MSIVRNIGSALLLATAAWPATASAAPTGVAELLRQADYWKGKGRGDLAQQAYRRVLAVDPGNAVARRGVSADVAPAPAPAPVRKAPAARQPAPAPAAPVATRAPVAQVDPGGPARAAGFVALEQGNLQTAAARFQTALKARPDDSDALGGLGIVRLRGKRFAEARDLLARASRGGSGGKWAEALGSASFFADLARAQTARDAGRLDQAEAQARKLVETGGGDKAAATALLADILGRQGRFGEAATLYNNAASATSGRGQAADLRGKAALAQARQAAASLDPISAERAFQQAIASDPADPWARYEYARFLLSLNQQQNAAGVIMALEERVSPEALYASALFWNQAGQASRADSLMSRIPENQRTTEMNGFVREAKINAAIAQARQLNAAGRTNEAQAGLRMVAGYSNLSVATLGTLADAFQSMGEPVSAQMLAQQALEMPLAEPESYAPIVSVLAQGGQDASASALIQKMLSTTGGRVTPAIGKLNAGLAAAQADRLRMSGQNAQAFDVLQTAWSSAPNDQDILGALGRLYQSGGMGQQAMAVYDMLLRQKPNDVPTLIGVADAASIGGDRPRARAAIGRAMQLQPANSEVYLAAARIEQAAGNKGAALRYLKRAREIYGQQTMLAGGNAFPSANPFANTGGGGFGSGGMGGGMAPAAINPFALGRDSGSRGRSEAAQFQPLPSPYSAPASPVYASAQSPFGGAGPMGGSPPFGGSPSFGGGNGGGGGGGGGVGMPTFASPGGNQPMQMAGNSRGISDPTLQRINNEIEALSANSGPSVKASTSFRARSGESGLSRLTEIGAKVEIGTSVGSAGRVSISAAPVVLDAGGLSRSALARYGANPIGEALGIALALPSVLAPVDSQHDTGVAFNAKVEAGTFSADVGSTPIGFDKIDVQGGVSWSPKPTPDTTVKVFAERRPVTDSIVAYAGARDPLTDIYWGKVMRNGGGVSLSFDSNGNGVYADAAYRAYRGRNVRNNEAIEANVGGYLSVYRTDATSVTAGANLNYQAYDNNQNFFSLGHGGYFSPQSFVSLAFPVHYSSRFGDWSVEADVSPGYQSYDQENSPLFPTAPAAQAALDALKLVNDDVRSRYDSISKSGFGFSGGLSAMYRIGTATNVGGEMKYNTFGQYNEFQTNLKITQAIGGR